MATLSSIANLPLGKGVKHVVVTSTADIAGIGLREGTAVFWHRDRPVGHVLIGRKRVADRLLKEEITGCASWFRLYHGEGRRK